MRILVFADLQADEGSDRRRSDPSVPLQRWRVQQFYRWAATLVRERALDAVWDLGDTTHNRSALTHPTLQVVTQGCAELTAGLDPIYNFKLLGNHEQHLKAQHAHVGALFHPYFHVVPDRAVFTLPHLDLHVVCASYPRDPGELSGWLSSTLAQLTAHRVVVLGHFGVQGARLSSGVEATGVEGVVLARADRVLLGHVHRRQKVGAQGWYLGSPFQQDFGEAHDPQKCVGILDTETLEVEFVATPFPCHRTITVKELPAASRGDDVLRVLVHTPAEAQQLYAAPAAGTVEPVYAFDSPGGSAPNPAATLDFDPLTRAYVDQVPLPGASATELLGAAAALQQ